MNTNKDIERDIDRIVDAIDAVKVSPFFKEKTMHRLFSEKAPEELVFPWFTPKLQFAALVGVIVFNAFVFSNLGVATTDENVDEFTEVYALNTDSEISLSN